jgi:hypothetical protein
VQRQRLAASQATAAGLLEAGDAAPATAVAL